jgi:leader peptidase (prepilin peptidase) / N-methyltransferase
MLIEVATLLIAAVFGLVFGSFITMASYRLPREQEIFVTPSHCTSCDTVLKARDLVPLFSWLGNHGHCRYCKSKVHWRYPIIEAVTALVFMLIVLSYGITVQAILLAFMAVWLLIMIVADFEHYMIPDEVHIVLIPLGTVYHFVTDGDWVEVGGGTMLGLLIGLSLRYSYLWFRNKEALGWGDVKFLATAGFWLGVMPIVPFLFLSGLLGVATSVVWRAMKRGALFPFGPALAIALFLCVAFPEVPHAFWNLNRWLLQ